MSILSTLWNLPPVMGTRPRRPRNSTKTTFPRPSPHSHESPTHRRSYVFLALSRPFHSILQHIHIILPFSKYSTRSRLQRLHRFAEARPFVTLLYLDARIHPRTASAACSVFVLHFISHLNPVACSPSVFILHTNYYTQSRYKRHSRNTMYRQQVTRRVCSDFVSTSRLRPRPRIKSSLIVVFSRSGSKLAP